MPTPSEPQRSAFWQALGLAWELGYLIIVPLIIFALAGRWADQQFGTSPWLFLGGMTLAIITTTIFLVRKFSGLIRDIDETTKGKS